MTHSFWKGKKRAQAETVAPRQSGPSPLRSIDCTTLRKVAQRGRQTDTGIPCATERNQIGH